MGIGKEKATKKYYFEEINCDNGSTDYWGWSICDMGAEWCEKEMCPLLEEKLKDD